MRQGTAAIDSAITAAAQAHGATNVVVTRQNIKPHPSLHGSDGEWLLLACDGAIWGRRRTRAELVALAKRGAFNAVMGKE